MVTINDIALRAEVSQSAVSWVLNGTWQKRRISPLTRDRVQVIARQLGYVPHRAARALRRGKTDTILVTTRGGLHHAHVHEFIEAFNDALVPHGKEMLLEFGHQTKHTDRVLRTLTGGGADGIVVFGSEPRWLAELLAGLPAGLPKVLIGAVEPPSISSVEYDRVRATELAVTHLLEQGHQQVAMVYDLTHDKPPEQRRRGYQVAMEKAGLPFDETLLLRAATELPDGVGLWERLRARQPRPTGVFCYNDELAFALLHAIQLDGGRVPADVALVTTGNTRLTRLGDVPLTTVDTNYRGIAQMAVEILLEQMQDPNKPVRHVRVVPHLMVRESSQKRG